MMYCHIKITYFRFVFILEVRFLLFYIRTLLHTLGSLLYIPVLLPLLLPLSSLDLVISSLCTLVWTWQSSEMTYVIMLFCIFYSKSKCFKFIVVSMENCSNECEWSSFSEVSIYRMFLIL